MYNNNKIEDGLEIITMDDKLNGIGAINGHKPKSHLPTDDDELPMIPLTKYHDYFDAIIRDDIGQVEKTLQQASSKEKQMLVHSPFDFEDEQFKDMYAKSTRAVMPFHLAVCFSSMRVASLFIRNKVDVKCIDPDGKNVLHCASVASHYNKDIEADTCKSLKWLEENISEDDLKSLLYEENQEGYRPLEYAAKQGTLMVMKTLLQMKTYRTGEKQRGFTIYQLIDITEYELGKRNSKSPLQLLAYLDRRRLEDPLAVSIILDPVISKWIDNELKSNLIPILIWLGIRMFMMVMYFLIDVDASYIFAMSGENGTDMFCKDLTLMRPGLWFSQMLCFLIIFLCMAILISDILLFIKTTVTKQYRHGYNLDGKKQILVNTQFYFILQTIFLLVFMICTMYYLHILLTLEPMLQWMVTATTLARVIIPILLLWSLLYFLQMLPVIGPKIISLQTMVTDMGSFLLLFAISSVFFVHVFETFALNQSKVGCIEEFKDPYTSLYTSFLLMLNIYSTDAVNVHNKIIFEILHVLYATFVGIMLVNFLIAVMSESANRVAQNERVIFKLNQLAMAMCVQDRAYWFIPRCLMYRLRKMGYYCSDGHCYLRSMVDRRKMLFNKVEDSSGAVNELGNRI